MSTEIKMHNLIAVSFSFIWGLTEDNSRGDSLSESSEERLPRGKGGGQHVTESGVLADCCSKASN